MREDVVDGCRQREEGSVVAFRFTPRDRAGHAGSHQASCAIGYHPTPAEATSPAITLEECGDFRSGGHARGCFGYYFRRLRHGAPSMYIGVDWPHQLPCEFEQHRHVRLTKAIARQFEFPRDDGVSRVREKVGGSLVCGDRRKQACAWRPMVTGVGHMNFFADRSPYSNVAADDTRNCPSPVTGLASAA
jgi:hypothetical protein